MKAISIVAVVGLLSLQLSGQALALTPAEKCESVQNMIAGKYAFCRHSAVSKAIKGATSPDYARCDTAFSTKWGKSELVAEGACPTLLDQAAVQAIITQYVGSVATGLDGSEFPDVVAGGAYWVLGGFGESCDQACAAAGMDYDGATSSYAGSGGTDAICIGLLNLLNAAGTTLSPLPCADAFGCSADNWGMRARCSSTTSTASHVQVRRVCACNP